MKILKSTPKQLERARLYRESHREHYRDYFKKYDKGRAEYQNQKARKWRESRPEYCILRRRIYCETFPERVREASKRYAAKVARDPKLRAAHLVTCSAAKAIFSTAKRPRGFNRFGASIADVRKHIESKFKPGMTWENHGVKVWHVDHIIPRSRFDLSDQSQVDACFHYSNLQPLWYFENQKKHTKILKP